MSPRREHAVCARAEREAGGGSGRVGRQERRAGGKAVCMSYTFPSGVVRFMLTSTMKKVCSLFYASCSTHEQLVGEAMQKLSIKILAGDCLL